MLITASYDKVRQSVTEQSKSKKHGLIAGSDLGRNGLIRACDWSMLFALLLLCNTLTHFVIMDYVCSIAAVAEGPALCYYSSPPRAAAALAAV